MIPKGFGFFALPDFCMPGSERVDEFLFHKQDAYALRPKNAS